MIEQDGYTWKAFLWNPRFGNVTALGDQWTDYYTGTRYGSFVTNYMAMQVNLPLDDVTIEHYIEGVAV